MYLKWKLVNNTLRGQDLSRRWGGANARGRTGAEEGPCRGRTGAEEGRGQREDGAEGGRGLGRTGAEEAANYSGWTVRGDTCKRRCGEQSVGETDSSQTVGNKSSKGGGRCTRKCELRNPRLSPRTHHVWDTWRKREMFPQQGKVALPSHGRR